MKINAALAFGAALIAVPVLAQEQGAAAEPAAAVAPAPPAVVVPPVIAPAPAPVPVQVSLPAGTNVRIGLARQLHSNTDREGDTFPLTVLEDVRAGGAVVIPRGTGGSGEITWRTGKGVFGKSAKMEIALRYIELDGRRIPVEGGHLQEGEGNTAATIGAVLAAGVIGGLVVTGRSAVVDQGREFSVLTSEAVPFQIEGEGAAAMARLDSAYVPGPVATGRLRPAAAEEGPGTCEQEGRRRAPNHPSTAREFQRDCERRNRRRG